MTKIRLYAVDKKTGQQEEIDNLYWFEEEGVRDWNGESLFHDYAFRIEIESRDTKVIAWTDDRHALTILTRIEDK